jgi:hypothetical protein
LLNPFKSSKAWSLPGGALLLCLSLGAPQLAAQPAVSSSRYLLIVDTSGSMQRRAKGMLSTVQDLLASGMQGQLRRGDTLGVWTFNEELYTGRFPLQVWEPEEQRAIGRRALAFLKAQHYAKQPNLDKVIPALDHVVKDSEVITVILISAGDANIHGTPFDGRINDVYARWRNEQPKARKPLVTVLRARNGKIANCSVTPAPGPVEILPLPPPEAPVVRTEKPAPAPPATRLVMAPPLILSGKRLPPETAGPSKREAPVKAETPPAGGGSVESAPSASDKPSPSLALQPGTAPLSPAEPRAERQPLDAISSVCEFWSLDPGTSTLEAQLPTDRQVVGQASRLPAGPLALDSASVSSVSAPGLPLAPGTSNALQPGGCAPAAAGQSTTAATASGPPVSSVHLPTPSAPVPAPSARGAVAAPPGPDLSRLGLWAGSILAAGCSALGLLRLRRAGATPRPSLISRSFDHGRTPPDLSVAGKGQGKRI